MSYHKSGVCGKSEERLLRDQPSVEATHRLSQEPLHICTIKILTT